MLTNQYTKDEMENQISGKNSRKTKKRLQLKFDTGQWILVFSNGGAGHRGILFPTKDHPAPPRPAPSSTGRGGARVTPGCPVINFTNSFNAYIYAYFGDEFWFKYSLTSLIRTCFNPDFQLTELKLKFFLCSI